MVNVRWNKRDSFLTSSPVSFVNYSTIILEHNVVTQGSGINITLRINGLDFYRSNKYGQFPKAVNITNFKIKGIFEIFCQSYEPLSDDESTGIANGSIFRIWLE